MESYHHPMSIFGGGSANSQPTHVGKLSTGVVSENESEGNTDKAQRRTRWILEFAVKIASRTNRTSRARVSLIRSAPPQRQDSSVDGRVCSSPPVSRVRRQRRCRQRRQESVPYGRRMKLEASPVIHGASGMLDTWVRRINRIPAWSAERACQLSGQRLRNNNEDDSIVDWKIGVV